MTPSNHRVHHAQNERYIDKNYGGIFILWDRMFGTFEDEREDDPVVFGVRKPLANWNPFWANLQVYDYLLFDSLRAKSWKDKLGVWFRRTGWRPPDVEERYPKQRADLSGFEKFDPPVSTGLRRYVMGQFLASVPAVLGISVLFATRGAGAVLAPCVLLWVHLYSIGLMNEGRSGAMRFEAFRLLVINALGVWWLSQSGEYSGAAFWAVAAVYTAASLLGLYAANTVSKQLDTQLT